MEDEMSKKDNLRRQGSLAHTSFSWAAFYCTVKSRACEGRSNDEWSPAHQQFVTMRGRRFLACRRQLAPKILEAVGRHLGVPDRVLNVLVPEVLLQGRVA